MSKNNKNPKVFLAEIQALIGVSLTLAVNIKLDGIRGVDSAKAKTTAIKITPQTLDPKTCSKTTTITPPTPDPKVNGDKKASTSKTAAENVNKQKNVKEQMSKNKRVRRSMTSKAATRLDLCGYKQEPTLL